MKRNVMKIRMPLMVGLFLTMGFTLCKAQTFEWAKRIGGRGEDIPGKIAVDGSGNVLIGGWYTSAGCDFDPGAGTANLSSAGLGDIFFAKYDTDGQYLWAKSMGSIGPDGCHDIRADKSGNVFITGYFAGAVDFDPGLGTATLTDAGGGDLYFAKFDSSGNYLWAKRAGGSLYEVGNGINIDRSGNIYISGPFESTDADFDPGAGTALLGSAGGHDMYLAKYDAMGNYIWAKRTGGSTDELGGDIESDGSGNIIVLGVYQSANIDFDAGPGTKLLSSAGGWDVSVAKFTPDGNLLWANGFGSAGDDYYSGLSIDDNDFVYLSGLFSNTIDLNPGAGTARATSAGSFDGFYAIFDTDGKYVWSKSVGGRLNENGGPVALDSTGHLLSVLNFNGSGVDVDTGPGTFPLTSAGGTDLAIMKFSLHPEPDTINQIAFSNTCPDGNNEIYTVYADGTGLKRLTNSSERECGPAWSPDGDRIAFQSNRSGDHEIYVIRTDGSNPVRLTNNPGEDGEPAWSPDGMRIAYSSMVGGRYEIKVMNIDDARPFRLVNLQLHNINPAWKPASSASYDHQSTAGGFSLLQNYPNPTQGQTMIGFNPGKEGPVVLDVVDVTGRVVFSRNLGIINGGEHRLAIDLTSLTPGQYYYKLTSGKNVIVKKLVKY